MYWESVRDEKFSFLGLPGKWVAIETADKPKRSTELIRGFVKELGGSDDGLGISWNTLCAAIDEAKKLILDKIGLSAKQADVRLLDALEWNLLANREGWGETNTYEWTNTEFKGFGYKRLVIVGKFDDGGAGCVSTRSPVSCDNEVGFRAAIVLDP